MAICLLPEKINDFKKAIANREIKIRDLVKMESQKREELLRKFAGDNAKDINKLFEEKLVLKNKELGIKNVIDKLKQTGKYSPRQIEKIQSIKSKWKEKQMERIMSPKETEVFLAELAKKEAGTDVTREEASQLFDLERNANEKLEAGYDKVAEVWKSEREKAEYGAAKVAYEKYFEYLKSPDETLKQIAGNRYEQFKSELKENPAVAVKDLIIDLIGTITDNTISTVASLDNSFIGRQGIRTLYTRPTVWAKAAKQSFLDFAKTIGGQETMDALMADVYSRPNYLNGQYKNAGLVSSAEEQFPSSLPERIPLAGRLFKASEAAFKGTALRMRLDLYDLLTSIGKDQGVDFNKKEEAEALGLMINSLTSKGNLQPSTQKTLKMALWAPRMIKSHIDVLTDPVFAKSKFARKQAAWNLLKISLAMATIMAVANAIYPGSAETDPTSADFGKIKVKNTRFDFTGGMGSLLVLAARLYAALTGGKMKTTTGKYVSFGSGYGQKNAFSLMIDFLTNKTTPPVGTIIEFLKGVDRNFEKPTVGKAVMRNITPIFLQNIIEAGKDPSVEVLVGVLADAIGISSNTYEPLKKK